MKPEVFRAAHLTCEFQSNPVGVDCLRPRFSWKIFHEERGQFQTACHILVASSEELINRDVGDCWDSREVISDNNILVPYGGKKLTSLERFFWKVRVADRHGQWCRFSSVHTFVTGILYKSEWKASWIGFAGGANGQGILARRQVTLKDNIKSAFIAVTGLGYYELYINGDKVGDHVLDPGLTDYTRHVLYCVYDVASYLHLGSNVLGMILGNGWHGAPRFLLQLRIVYRDGTDERILSETDAGWQIGRSQFVENSIFDGEVYDARLEKDGWSESSYQFEKFDRIQNGWIHAMALSAPGGQMKSQTMAPIRILEEIIPRRLPDGAVSNGMVYDVGQNIAGWVSIRAKGNRGDRITMRYAETLYEDGSVNQENLRTALARDVYICRGAGKEIYAPRFTYHGFRYVQVECEGNVQLYEITAQRVGSDIRRTGRFSCSHVLLNEIDRMIVETERNNIHSIPTDCPQRDERMGWVNDATVRAEESVCHFDMAALYEKWVQDIRDTQDVSGAIADTAPFYFGKRPADPVGSAYLLIPWLLYLHYGDQSCMETYYESMKRWEEFLESIAEDHIIYFSRFGDWASPRSECEDSQFGSGAVSRSTPGSFLSSGYSYLNCRILGKFAKVLEISEDVVYYNKLAEEIRCSVLRHFWDEEKAVFCKGSQASFAFALKLGIVPEKYHDRFVENYLAEVERHGYHLSTGNQCTKYLLETLTEEGHVDLACRILCQQDYPGWGYMVRNGATTVWERWEYAVGREMNSHDHPMHGAVASWFFQYLVGIKPDEASCGFKKILFRPFLAHQVNRAEAVLESVRGTIRFHWERTDNGLLFSAAVPVNCTAKLHFTPEREFEMEEMKDCCMEYDEGRRDCCIRFGSGQYEFVIRWK